MGLAAAAAAREEGDGRLAAREDAHVRRAVGRWCIAEGGGRLGEKASVVRDVNVGCTNMSQNGYRDAGCKESRKGNNWVTPWRQLWPPVFFGSLN